MINSSIKEDITIIYALNIEAPQCKRQMITTIKKEYGVCQGCILSPYLGNLYEEYIMRNAGLYETRAGIKITGRNINNLRYADDTTLMAERKVVLNSLLMKVKEESEKVDLKVHIQKTKVMASHPITS